MKSDVILMGFRPPETEAEVETFYAHNEALAEVMPTMLLVCSSGEADLMS